MMKELTSYADEHNYPIYLESSKEVNLPFYQKHGFFVLERKRLCRISLITGECFDQPVDFSLPFGTISNGFVSNKQDRKSSVIQRGGVW